MIHLFAGEDSYRSREAYLAAREEARGKNGITVLRDDGLTEEKFAGTLNGQTIFGASPAVALEGIAGLTGGRADNFLALLKNVPSSLSVFIWERTKPDSRLKIWNYLKSNAQKFELFSFLDGFALKKWIMEKAQKEEARLSEDAANLLAKSCGADLWALSGEISKLAVYARGREIAAQDVREISVIKEEVNVFHVVRSLALSDGRGALRGMAVCRALGEDTRFIISQATKETRALLAIRDLMDRRLPIIPERVASQTGIKDFAVAALQRSAGRMNTARLRRLYDQLVVSLYAMNNGRAEPDDVLDMLALGNI